jgi:23S rRNA (guanosine2251-2'-O)-methyltransferase
VVAEALRQPALVISELWSTPAARMRPALAELWRLAVERRVQPAVIDAAALTRLVGYESHQGVACRLAHLPQTSLLEIIGRAPKPNLLALDRVQDPMNLGAILRNANSFGVAALICPKDHTAPLSAAAIKASAGAALVTPVVYVTNLARALDELKEAGFWVVALLPPDGGRESPRLSEFTPPSPWVLLAGGEGGGLRPLVARTADFTVTIPMQGAVESLNVASACAVALFSLAGKGIAQGNTKTS